MPAASAPGGVTMDKAQSGRRWCLKHTLEAGGYVALSCGEPIRNIRSYLGPPAGWPLGSSALPLPEEESTYHCGKQMV
jgi:hypothetical protein